MTIKFIQRIELGSISADITFSSIPQTEYTDLLLVYSLRTDLGPSFAFDDCSIRVNNDSGANYTNQLVQTRDGSMSAGGGSGQTNILSPEASAAGASGNTFGNGEIYISNYRSSAPKTFSCKGGSETNSTTAVVQMFNFGLWNSTAPITSLYLYSRNGRNFVAGSSATLYGIKKGSDGTTTVS